VLFLHGYKKKLHVVDIELYICMHVLCIIMYMYA